MEHPRSLDNHQSSETRYLQTEYDDWDKSEANLKSYLQIWKLLIYDIIITMTIVTARLTNNLVYKVTIITYSNSKYISWVVTRDKVLSVSFETFELVLSDVTYFIVAPGKWH